MTWMCLISEKWASHTSHDKRIVEGLFHSSKHNHNVFHKKISFWSILAWDTDSFFHTASKRGQGIMQQQDATYCFGVKTQTKYQILMINRNMQDSPESLHRQILIVSLRDLTPHQIQSLWRLIWFFFKHLKANSFVAGPSLNIHGPAKGKSQIHCFDQFLCRKRSCEVTTRAWQSEHTSDLCQRAED